MQVWEQTGIKPEALDYDPCPDLLLSIWEYFKELELGRQFNEFGKLPFTYTEIESWSRLNNISLASSEVKLIKQLDLISLQRKNNE